MNTITYIQSLMGKGVDTELEHLISMMKDEYDEGDKSGMNYYEMFDMIKTEWKVHFDFDKKLPIEDSKKFDKKEYQEKIIDKLNYIFETKKDDRTIKEDNGDVKVLA